MKTLILSFKDVFQYVKLIGNPSMKNWDNGVLTGSLMVWLPMHLRVKGVYVWACFWFPLNDDICVGMPRWILLLEAACAGTVDSGKITNDVALLILGPSKVEEWKTLNISIEDFVYLQL